MWKIQGCRRMTRWRTTSMDVWTSSILFKQNITCFIESWLMMRQGFLSSPRKTRAREVSGSLQSLWEWRNQDSQKSIVKVILITFFEVSGNVHSKFLPQGQMITLQINKVILQCKLCSVREKIQDLWQNKSWLLHHSNAPAYNALGIQQYLLEQKIAVMGQPPYW